MSRARDIADIHDGSTGITTLGTVTTGTFDGTIGNSANFPAEHIITHTPQTVISTQYSSSGADITCTLLTTTINKKKSGSKIHVFGVLYVAQYSYTAQNTTGDIWCDRTAPTSLTNLGKRRSSFSFAAGSQAYILKRHLMPFSFYDDSSATGNHTYVVHCQMDTGNYFKVGEGVSSYGNSTIQAYEVETS